jgi:peptide/nickel transport system permease protein
MLKFLLKRIGVMLLTMFVLTLIVFFFVNLEAKLKTLAVSQTNIRVSEEGIESWLQKNGYRDPFLERYAEWLGVWPKDPNVDEETGKVLTLAPRCTAVTERQFQGVLQGYFGCSTKFKVDVANKLFGALSPNEQAKQDEKEAAAAQARAERDAACNGGTEAACKAAERTVKSAERRAVRPMPALYATGVLMFWVMIIMVPAALLIGVVAGMREGSRTDRSLSVVSITSTATPEYVSGVIFAVVFASGLGWLNASAATAISKGVTFNNFALPVMTMAVYGVGYIARMTRASMAEVMMAQYIRTARLKGLNFRTVVLRHALRNALIAPFTVIMLQFPWLLTGVVIVETMFVYRGFGDALVAAAGNNDIDLLLACSLVSVVVVLLTQLISDVGYVFLNPRIRVS